MGIFMNFIWPVPLIILGVRHGLRWSGLALVTSGIIIAILANPLQSLFLIVGLGFIGLTLGWSIRKGSPTMVILGLGSIASFISKIAVFAMLFSFMGINPLEINTETGARATESVLDFYRSVGMSEYQIEHNKAEIVSLLELLKIALPAVIIMGAFADTFINFWVAKKILRRLGTFIPDLPAFRELVLPLPIVLFYGLSLIALYFFSEQPTVAAYYRISVNFNLLCAALLMLQGLAVAWFYIHKHNWPGFLRGVLLTSLFITQLVPVTIVFLGIADSFLDFRKLRPQRC